MGSTVKITDWKEECGRLLDELFTNRALPLDQKFIKHTEQKTCEFILEKLSYLTQTEGHSPEIDVLKNKLYRFMDEDFSKGLRE